MFSRDSKIKTKARISPYRTLLPVVVIVGLFALFGLVNPVFLGVANLLTMTKQLAVILMLALAGTFVVLMGSFDFSVAAVLTLTGVIVALTIPQAGTAVAIVIGIGIGIIVGACNALIFVKARIPSFMVTLGTMIALGGISTAVSQGYLLSISDPVLRQVSAGKIGGISYLAIWSILILLVSLFVTSRTIFGRNLYAIGLNIVAARISGVAIEKTRLIAFTISGLLAGVAGVLYVAEMGTAGPGVGDSMLLPVMAAIFAGGNSITGGIGSPARTFLGALTLTILVNGMNVLQINSYLQSVFFGVVVIVAIALTIDREKIKLIS
jgi:ribose transport system permease protein/putative xylitol transport system permease protein